jgi:hypothetical protein
VLILLLLLFFVVVTIFLTAWTLWFQAYIYSEPAQILPWRAPAAGAAITGYIAFWVLLVYLNPGKLGTLTTFAASEGVEYDELTLTDKDGQPIKRLREDAKGIPKELPEKYKKVGSPPIYRLDGQPKGAELPQHPEGLRARSADGNDHVFVPDRDAKGQFQVRERSFLGVKQSSALEYRDKETGQVMEEGQLGRVSMFYFGRFLANMILNLLHLVVWFVCLWLLLEFQWSHALGQAIILWLVTMLFILPPLFGRAEDLRVPPTPEREQQSLLSNNLPLAEVGRLS